MRHINQTEWIINQYFEIHHYQPLLFVIEDFEHLFYLVHDLERKLDAGLLDNLQPGDRSRESISRLSRRGGVRPSVRATRHRLRFPRFPAPARGESRPRIGDRVYRVPRCRAAFALAFGRPATNRLRWRAG
jgi:hypothetical protein